MARAKGSMKLGENIEPQIGAPLDARTLVKTKADLTNPKSYEYAYVGMEVMVKDELKKYVLKAKDTTLEENWEESSGGSIDPAQLEGLATKEELKDYVKKEELENYVTKDELDDVSGSTPKAIPVPIVDTEASQFTYDGTPKKLVFTNVNEKDVVIIDDIKTDAGTYICKIYPKGLNVWIGERDYKTYEYEWSIAKAESQVTIDKESITLNNSSPSDTFNYTTTGDGVVTVTSSDTTVATVNGNTNPITVNNVNEKNGSIYVTVSVAEGNNYLGSSNTIVINSEFLHVVTWANGSDEEIADMILSAYNGELNYNSENLNAGGLYDYWAIGDERTMKVSFNGTEEYITLVLEETGDTLQTYNLYRNNTYYGLVDTSTNNSIGRKFPWFIVGTKNLLSSGYKNNVYPYNSTRSNDGLPNDYKGFGYSSTSFRYRIIQSLDYLATSMFSTAFANIIRQIKYPYCYAQIYSGHGFGENPNNTSQMGTESFNLTSEKLKITRHAVGELLSESVMESNCENSISKLLLKEKNIKQFTYYKELSTRIFKENGGINQTATAQNGNYYSTRSLGLMSLPSGFDNSSYSIKATHSYGVGVIKTASPYFKLERCTTGNLDFIFAI